MRIGSVAIIVAVFALALSVLLLQQRVSLADGHECPSSWPSESSEGLHTDDQGKGWFIIRSADSNGYESVRAYAADDAYSAGYAPGSPDEICYLIVRRPGDTADAAEPTQVTFLTGDSEFEQPAWVNVADPEQYTRDYVERAIEHYKQHGLESMKRYYNSAAAYEGQWYLFATDADDIYIVHPLLPYLIGTDIKNVEEPDTQFELGKALAAARDGGPEVWVHYDWPHPLTLKRVRKIGYAKRYDGLLFASGYYPTPDDLALQAKASVQEIIAYYNANGLDATLAKYDNPDSVNGHLSTMIIDGQGIVRAFTLQPGLKGAPVSALVIPATGRKVGEELLAATEDGIWVNFYFPPVIAGTGTDYQHGWLRRHDGLIFGVGYSDDQPDVPDAAR